ALVEINRALEEVPDEPYFLNNRGFIHLQMDSLDLAIQDIDRSILLNPNNGWAYRNKGIFYMKRADYKQAIRLFKRAIDEPDFIDEVFYYLGLAYEQSGDRTQACESWYQGVAQNESASVQMIKACD
ncbi:MAG: tetratricopeptide repeat protein, partial [Bacteroidota bacterium]